MGKKHKSNAKSSADRSQPAGTLTAPSSAFDGALASLFATSVRPKLYLPYHN